MNRAKKRGLLSQYLLSQHLFNNTYSSELAAPFAVRTVMFGRNAFLAFWAQLGPKHIALDMTS